MMDLAVKGRGWGGPTFVSWRGGGCKSASSAPSRSQNYKCVELSAPWRNKQQIAMHRSSSYLEVCFLRVQQLPATSCSAEEVASRVQRRLHRVLYREM